MVVAGCIAILKRSSGRAKTAKDSEEEALRLRQPFTNHLDGSKSGESESDISRKSAVYHQCLNDFHDAEMENLYFPVNLTQKCCRDLNVVETIHLCWPDDPTSYHKD